MLENILTQLDIESEEDFRFFEQFAALMEHESLDIDYDTFVELIMMPGKDALLEMTESFFEDLIRGIPDDNTELYSVIQSLKDMFLSLAEHPGHRGRGFYADELSRFREWLIAPGIVECTPEAGGKPVMASPCEAFMMFRQEKLSGDKFNYDFSSAMPEGPSDYVLDIIAELSEEDYIGDCEKYIDDFGDDPDGGLDSLPVELPSDFDAENFDPDSFDPETIDGYDDIDPYKDGFVDRYNPVIEGPDIDCYGGLDDDCTSIVE